jgi:membrane protein YdbS with pleckstrin-like domain
MIGRVLERDRLRVRFLAWATVLLWLLAAVGVFLIVWCFLKYLEPKMWLHAAEQDTAGRRDIAGSWVMIGNATAWSVAGLAAVVLLAAVSSVWLVLASRRATLRQMNARLAEITEQLRQLQTALASKHSGPPGSA